MHSVKGSGSAGGGGMGMGGWRGVERSRMAGAAKKPGFLRLAMQWIGRLLLVLAALCGVVAVLKWKVFTGVPSTVLWQEDEAFRVEDLPALVKTDGQDFRILLLSDLQLEANPFVDTATLSMIDDLVKRTDPDLILTDGDNTYMPLQAVMAGVLVRRLDRYGIPWDVTLGNHDAQFLADRNWHANLYASGTHSLFQAGPSNIHGVGNHALRVTDPAGNTLVALVLMDSNAQRLYADGMAYDAIYPDQIRWYEWLMAGLARDGRRTPSLLFFHIPLPEYQKLSDEWAAGRLPADSFIGENRETVCAAPVNSGLFAAVKASGSTTHIFTGHDHINCLSATYEGVRLTYGLKTGADSYSDPDLQGGTLITIRDGSPTVDVAHVFMAK